MALYKCILCCLDFSQRSQKVFDTAVEQARLNQAELQLLHVVAPSRPLLPRVKEKPRKSLTPEEVKKVKDYIHATYLGRVEGMEVKLFLRGGLPTVEILQHLAEQPVDLVVMGAEGLSGVGLVLLGSVAERVLRRAPCSCLICR